MLVEAKQMVPIIRLQEEICERYDEKKGKSPLEDIPYIKVDITTQEIVDLIRESRAGI